MAEPALVAKCVAAMGAAVSVPVTVKTRIGIDEQDSYEFLQAFVAAVAGAGCKTFIVHARKAWLSGLSPKQNREVPPLSYERVYSLKQEFPELEIVINGGITSLQEARRHLHHVDGVMMGRAAYQNPYLLAHVDKEFFGDSREMPGREQVARAMADYIDRQLGEGVRVASITRHMLGLFAGQPGARRWRRYLSEHAHLPAADAKLVADALKARRACQ